MRALRAITAHLVVTVLLAATSGKAWSWGSEGHRIVATIAQAELTARARSEVNRALGGESLEDASTWMDEVRSDRRFDYLKSWHFTKINVCSAVRLQCPKGNCSTSKARWAMHALHSSDLDERQFALRVLVHLVGDIHQPLHSADNHDAGGNGVDVENRRCGREGCDLHNYWDSYLVKKIIRGQSQREAALSLLRTHGKLGPRDSMDPQDWAIEANKVARNVTYPMDSTVCGQPSRVRLTPEYDEEAAAAVRTQLVKAGLRLAKALNQAFDR